MFLPVMFVLLYFQPKLQNLSGVCKA